MRADYHVHSNFSDDSDYPLGEICRDAVRAGLDEVCLTDHVDYGVKSDGARPRAGAGTAANVDCERYFPALEEARGAFRGRLSVKRGLELGVQSHTIGDYERLLDAHGRHLDFAILSIHQVGNAEFWNGDFQRGRSRREFNEAYWEEMLEVVEGFGGYSVLGHMDLVSRYDADGPYPLDLVRDVVAAILERAIADGKGIELNTSGIRYGLGRFLPQTPILELYRDLGGRIVTIGSDAHSPAHLGAHVDRARDLLASLGFDALCTFDRMEPTFHPIGA